MFQVTVTNREETQPPYPLAGKIECTGKDSDKESKDFYSQLQRLVDTIPKKDFIVVVGDFNTILGNDKSGYKDILGKLGIGQINSRETQLIDFCRDKNLFVTNTMFKHRRKRKVNCFLSLYGRTSSMIDYLLVSNWWKSAFTDTVTLFGADFDSDQSLLMSYIRLSIKAVVKSKQKVPRFPMEALKDQKMKQEYREQLNERPLKIMQETADLFSPANIDQLVLQNPEVFQNFPAQRNEEPPLRSEVEIAMKSLKSIKVPGIDGIQVEFLRVEPDVSIDLCHRIATAVCETKYYPKFWSTSVIVPLHKKGSKSNCDNFRPILLVSPLKSSGNTPRLHKKHDKTCDTRV
ncbi:hypothetical protein QYM36_001361 [Artemia franciscana]|uniref:Endonuclease/exonuclease/phosphatase domain-containing protein n=1 Tax=Artemia franciscana TaxID=6661 RepID=A0AA88IJE0_ARTSF|nr:hypothetical protein QYM36_001361 [Artemia franciscana]